MKIIATNKRNKTMTFQFDFWEIELMGYDVKKQQDAMGNFYENIIAAVDGYIKFNLGNEFKYGLKMYIDYSLGNCYFEVKPYSERLDEFIVEELKRNSRKWLMYNGTIEKLN